MAFALDSRMTYLEQVLSNLADLLDTGSFVNNRLSVRCAYAEVVSLCSNALVVTGSELSAAIDRVANACGCLAVITALRVAAENDRDVFTGEDADMAVDDAVQFVRSVGRASWSVSCQCGRSIDYRVADVLDVTPPATFGVICRACGHETSWFVPCQRPRC